MVVRIPRLVWFAIAAAALAAALMLATGTASAQTDYASYPSQTACPEGRSCVSPIVIPHEPVLTCPAGSTTFGSGLDTVCSVENRAEIDAIEVAGSPGTFTCPASYPSFKADTDRCSEPASSKKLVPPNVSQATPIFQCPAGTIAIGAGPSLLCLVDSDIQIAVQPVVSPPVSPAPPAAAPPVTAAPVVVTAPVVVPAPVVVSAASYGFGDSLPATEVHATALAHTGTDADLVAIFGLGMIAAGAIVLGSRRRLDVG